MSHLLRRNAVVVAALATFVSCATPATAPPAPAASPVALDTAHAARIARIETSLLPGTQVRGRPYEPATLEGRMRQLGVPAVSVAVIEGGQIAWAKAWGVSDAATGGAATTETLFQAASMSKPVAAMGALALVQEGRLTLDDDVNRWLRRWRVPAHEWAAESPVTLRRLLSHTAGLTVHGFPGYAAGAPVPTVEQVLSGVAPANTPAVVVSTRPGEVYRYSGGGTTVVQLLMEEVSGVPFARFMKERVLDPIGMAASTYEQPLPAAAARRAATAHRAGAQAVAGRYHSYPEMAAAGLWTTPSDLARWILAVQRSLAGDTTGVLKPWMARTMVAARPERHGIGPQVAGAGDSLRFLHGGANAGFRGVFVGFAERGSGAVIMTNADAGGTIGSELLLAIAAEYGWPGLAPAEIVPIALPLAALRSYEGRYGGPGDPIQVVLTVEGQSLIAATPDGARGEFVPVAPDRFRPVGGGADMVFERGEGVVVLLRVGNLDLARQPDG